MHHLPDLIQDLGLILMAAAVVSLLSKKLKQPMVLGYLVAGFLVGPHFTFFATVKDSASITIWAEIGVIFMLFSLGLEFSFKKLTQVGKTAAITAGTELPIMMGLGYLSGQWLGWSTTDSLFLAGILSISSTTIIFRTFDELNLKGNHFVEVVFGVLIIEDLLAVLLLVLLSSLVVTKTVVGSQLLLSSLRLGFFLVLWFLLGIYLIPIFLRKFRNLLNAEALLIVAIGLCLMMVSIASSAGFSPALGAFVMGSILAETPKGHRIAELILPVQTLFSAVFFVSVGMLIEPQVLYQNFGVIFALATVVGVGKILSVSLGGLLSGQSLKHSVQAGMSLAQIGEFSFIIATLGTSTGVIDRSIYPIAVAVSALTTFFTPYLIRYSGGLAGRLEAALPEGIRGTLTRYQSVMATRSDTSLVILVWREYGIKIFLNTVLVVAVTVGVSQLVLPQIVTWVGHRTWVEPAACALAVFLSAPFLWAIVLGPPQHAEIYSPEVGEKLRKLQIGIAVIRAFIGIFLLGFILSKFVSILAFGGSVLIAFAGIAALFFSRVSEPLYRKIEERFLSNLTENERTAIATQSRKPELAPWNATLSQFTLSQDSPLIAKSLAESGIKERFGVTVTLIERGQTRILAPKSGDLLLPGDLLFLIGTDDQLIRAREVIEKKPGGDLPPIVGTFGLTSLVILPTDGFAGKTIRNCGLREAVNGLIVGIERQGQRYLSPDSGMELLVDDLIWIVGDRDRIHKLVPRRVDVE